MGDERESLASSPCISRKRIGERECQGRDGAWTSKVTCVGASFVPDVASFPGTFHKQSNLHSRTRSHLDISKATRSQQPRKDLNAPQDTSLKLGDDVYSITIPADHRQDGRWTGGQGGTVQFGHRRQPEYRESHHLHQQALLLGLLILHRHKPPSPPPTGTSKKPWPSTSPPPTTPPTTTTTTTTRTSPPTNPPRHHQTQHPACHHSKSSTTSSPRASHPASDPSI